MPPTDRWAYEEANQPPSLAEYSTGWLRSRDLKPRTLALYQSLLDTSILPELGEKRLTAITPTLVRQWHTGLGRTVPPSGLMPTRCCVRSWARPSRSRSSRPTHA